MKFQTTLISLLCLLAPVIASAWTVVPDGGPKVSGVQQKLVVLHHEGQETLFWSPTVDVDKAGKVTIVMALPTPPSKVARLGKDAIEDLNKVVQVSWLEAAKKRGEQSSTLDFGEGIPSGTLEVHALTTQGEAAETSLSELLAELGMPEIDAQNLKYHVENNWTFLTVTWEAKAGRQTLAPLQFDFESPVPVLPLMAFSDLGGSVQALFFSVAEMSEPAESNLKKAGFTFAVDRRQVGTNPKESLWMIGQSSFYLRNVPIAPKTLLLPRLSEQRAFAQVAIVDDLTKTAKRWKSEPYAGEPGVSLESPTTEAAAPPEPAQTDISTPQDNNMAEVPPEVVEMLADAAELDWTLVCGAIGLVFFLGAITVVQVRRRF